MSRTTSRPLLAVGVACVAGVLVACGGSAGATSTTSPPTDQSRWQAQLDALPTVDGASRSAHDASTDGLTETFTVPSGAPACLQVLARLDASGYEVVAGAGADRVDPTTCLTASAADGVSTAAGTATILAEGGSQITLSWTATAYTVRATDT